MRSESRAGLWAMAHIIGLFGFFETLVFIRSTADDRHTRAALRMQVFTVHVSCWSCMYHVACCLQNDHTLSAKEPTPTMINHAAMEYATAKL